ncbi:hypothetical protein QAD02_003593, partial [Eretmocerus hayati]
FNLSIHEMPQVVVDAREVLIGNILSSTVPLCIEISLQTTEGDTMVLETWSLGVFSEYIDPGVKITYTIYNKMGILLKSLLCLSRVIPAYKLSVGQGPDSYLIHYKVYMEKPHLKNLGDNYKHLKVGQVYTPVGMIEVSVFYRMKMTISPAQILDQCMMLDSDHFYSDSTSKDIRYNKPVITTHKASRTGRVGAFVANAENIEIRNEELTCIPYSSLLKPLNDSMTVGMSTNQPPMLTEESSHLVNQSDTLKDSEGIFRKSIESSHILNQCREGCCTAKNTKEDFILIDL